MFLQLLKAKTKEERELSQLLSQLPSTDDLAVVGRGTIVIEPESIFESAKFKSALERAAKIVKR
ncbi:hypothetical protein [Pseudomonas pseudonitroreducens]|uniref:hypothetical protein n=1 Tax=Pseudomonas pseudonitroreducens TaxID=2892326 RepID=UPI001F2887D6|nr:hypothetical protein [Pseudomonas pseudonitroreducens]